MNITKQLFFIIALSASYLMADNFNQIERAIFEKHKGTINPLFVSNTNKLIKTLTSDGSWDDINYKDRSRTNWKPQLHYSRLQKLAQAYANVKSPFYRQENLKDAFIKSLTFYFNRRPKSTNWWLEDLNEPQQVLRSIIIFKQGKPESKRLDTIEKKYLDYYDKKSNPNRHGFGANRMDVALWHLYQAVLRKDEQQLKSAVNFSFDSLTFTTKEGFQHDGSNHAHGAQNYIYGYGEVSINRANDSAFYVKNSPYQISEEHLKVYRNFLLGGYAKSRRGNYICFSVTGRRITRIGGLKNSPTIYQTAKTTDPAYAFAYDLICKREKNPSFEVKPSHTYFYRSDFTTHHRSNYAFMVQTNSKHLYKQEMGNQENLKGRFLTEGATNILVDGDEYFNIMGHWDWRRIPGTTVPIGLNLRPKRSWGYYGTSNFTGGVSNGRYGAHCFQMNEYNTAAKKSWFCFDNEIVCLGSGILSKEKSRINTTINQCKLSGLVVLSGGGKIKNSQPDKEIGPTENIDWVWHNRVGYWLHGNSSIRLSTQNQKGNWININKTMGDVPSNGPVFKLWIDHGVAPKDGKYHYSILPQVKSADEMRTYNPKDVVILAHDNAIHAVYHTKLDILQAIFYQAKPLKRLGFEITPSEPVALIITKATTSSPEGYISDPAYKLDKVTLSFTNKFIKNKKIMVKLPTDKAHQGRSQELKFKNM